MNPKSPDITFNLREFTLLLQDYLKEFKRSVPLFLWVLIPVAVYFGYRQFNNKPQFTAKVSFMLNEAEAGQSGLTSILGQFGLSAPGQKLSLQKIIEIAKTRRIAETFFFSKTVVNGKDDYLANHLIDAFKSEGEWFSIPFWEKSDSLSDLRYKRSEISLFDHQERMALKRLHFLFLKRLETSFNEKTGIMELSIRLPVEDLSYQLCYSLYDQLSKFYIDKTIEKQQDTYDRLQHKVDSLRNLIHRKDYNLAGIKDSYRNTFLNEDLVPQTQVDRDIRMFSILYGEALKNLELASFTLQNKTPFIQALDLPMKPLEVKKENLFLNVIKTVLISFFLTLGFVILRKIWRDSLQTN
ncbi:MAG: hypothetical protein KA251_05290 [Saprospiraceae bacterium]|nr:hypothetical protein [Candidatus Vicinibacter affinis]MBP6172599.1 hypothetical protein [Saprospiraceae bacterium]MBK6572387.1 hypothetical protein [Candidatus Vicinibacter affinis]MBK7303986.1 hypothetical protein [Candidatus Vicinibacter affinis]MBK7694233.1 hypothetical protein [Candidatus Vicinibacter affinis]